MSQKITPSLWFDRNAEEAMNFYIDVFNGAPNKKTESKIATIKRYPGGFSEGPMADMEGKVLTGIFNLEDQSFMCLDGGPIFKFNESVSFMISCKDQEEIDYFWEKLSAVPESEQCGWCKDKFGLSWQVIPENMGELIEPPKALQAMLKMHKISIKELEEAGKE
jgi:predicted 3-demethylubiquinone-9 3-methyltransferase (glyoxalase superfamily)